MKKALLALAAALLASPAVLAESELSVVLQGGASTFTSSLAASAETGGAYGARLGFMPIPWAGIEGGWLGAQNDISTHLASGQLSSTLTTNNGYGDLRLNLLPGNVMPYVFGGLGIVWVNGSGASGIPNGNSGALPFGGGIEVNAGPFKIGGRYQYNYLFTTIYTGTHAVVATHGGSTDYWAATLDLGASFK
jgi:hypothetical protein